MFRKAKTTSAGYHSKKFFENKAYNYIYILNGVVLLNNALFMHVVVFLPQKSHINILQVNKEFGTQYDTSKL